jgi:hypothetical protein
LSPPKRPEPREKESIKKWVLKHSLGKVNLKRHVVRKDGREHVYYSLSETIQINKNRTVQRRVLNLGELNTTLNLKPSSGTVRLRLLKRKAKAGKAGFSPVAKVELRWMPLMRAKSFYQVCRFADRLKFGACWLGSRLWQELGLDEFLSAVLHDRRGSVEWAKMAIISGSTVEHSRLS